MIVQDAYKKTHAYQRAKKNPFADNFLKKELAFYRVTDYDEDGVRIITKTLDGRIAEYLNKGFYTDVQFPVMFIDGNLWMSLSFAEIQSHFLPIEYANGVVGTGGLGMGYFTLRAAAKDEVERVDVYEINPRVIEFFKKSFSRRKGFKKINFIEGDVRLNLKGKEYDFFFMDIYQSMELNQWVIDDINNSKEYSTIIHYHFWGLERIVLAGYNKHIISAANFAIEEIEYFKQWMESGKENMYDNDADCYSEDEIENCLTALGVTK